MFTYLTEQDLFAEIYRNQLARRLLNQRSGDIDDDDDDDDNHGDNVDDDDYYFKNYEYCNDHHHHIVTSSTASDDMERLMISKLKLRCGGQFTSKMEGTTDINKHYAVSHSIKSS